VTRVCTEGFDVETKLKGFLLSEMNHNTFDEENKEWRWPAADLTHSESEDDDLEDFQATGSKRPAAALSNDVVSKRTQGGAQRAGAGEKAIKVKTQSKSKTGDADDDDFATSTKKSKQSKGQLGIGSAGNRQPGIGSFFSKGSAPQPSTSSSKSVDKSASSATITERAGQLNSDIKVDGMILPEGGFIPPFIASQLKRHQVEGVNFMWKHIASEKPGGCILAHSMGLGKSLQVCALAHAFFKRQKARKDTGRVMLVVPSSLLDNWMNEFKKWVNKSSTPEIKVRHSSQHPPCLLNIPPSILLLILPLQRVLLVAQGLIH